MLQKDRKCDVIIPVYNAPEWVKVCVYSVIKNTPEEYLGTVFLMNDKSNNNTVDCLKNLRNKYLDKVKVITNEENLGFIKNTNKGIKASTTNYVLLLNSDCIISKNTIPKLISHIEKNSKIGLISPIANNAANVSLDMFDGFSYSQMNTLLEKKFLGKNFDACTIVGNCLMVTRECINSVGLLDEIYGMGYGEETDYQFKAMQKGFEAKIAIDTYVFHKAEVSFGNSEEKKKKLAENREIFFSRWEKEYDEEARKYASNDPIQYINENLTEKDKEIKVDTMFYLPFITQNAGGVHMVFDIVNYLSINNYNTGVLYNILFDYEELALFKPIQIDKAKFKANKIVTTLWISVFNIMKFANELGVPIINFVQGYENYFENGMNYASVELTHKIVDYELVVSKYLQDRLKKIFKKDSILINNGINYDLLHHENRNSSAKNITFILRGNTMKGDFILLDVMKQLDNLYNGLVFRVVCNDEKAELPFIKHNEVIKIQGPLSRLRIAEILKETDIYVDASINEGFGLIALESIASGAIPIASNSFGVLEYLENGKNGYIINDINNSDRYVEKISLILKDKNLFAKLKEGGKNSTKDFDYDLLVDKYIEYFGDEKTVSNENKRYTKEELEIISFRESKEEVRKEYRGLFFYVAKLIPKRVKEFMKKIFDKIYLLYDHSE